MGARTRGEADTDTWWIYDKWTGLGLGEGVGVGVGVGVTELKYVVL